MLAILKSGGSKQKWIGENEIEIQNDDFDPEKFDQKLISEIRSSILLLGPVLARFKKFHFTTPGGCKIGVRPIDTHLEAIKDLGAEADFDPGEEGSYSVRLNGVKNQEVYLKEFSVTATENLLMLGFAYPLKIRLAAIEPHIFDLAEFLKKLGAEIKYCHPNIFLTDPGKLNAEPPINHCLISDPIETITLAILGIVTKSKIKISGIQREYLDAPLQKLKEFGAVFSLDSDNLLIDGSKSSLQAAKVQTLPYPGLPTDLQAPFGVLATQAKGPSLIFDTLYEGRLKYIDELRKMGADAVILDSHRALITGPTVLHGTKIDSLDLRAGATLVIAALAAEGQTELGNIEQIDRGYENLDGRLRELGADIKRSD